MVMKRRIKSSNLFKKKRKMNINNVNIAQDPETNLLLANKNNLHPGIKIIPLLKVDMAIIIADHLEEIRKIKRRRTRKIRRKKTRRRKTRKIEERAAEEEGRENAIEVITRNRGVKSQAVWILLIKSKKMKRPSLEKFKNEVVNANEE